MPALTHVSACLFNNASKIIATLTHDRELGGEISKQAATEAAHACSFLINFTCDTAQFLFTRTEQLCREIAGEADTDYGLIRYNNTSSDLQCFTRNYCKDNGSQLSQAMLITAVVTPAIVVAIALIYLTNTLKKNKQSGERQRLLDDTAQNPVYDPTEADNDDGTVYDDLIPSPGTGTSSP